MQHARLNSFFCHLFEWISNWILLIISPLLDLVNYPPPPYTCIIFDNHFCIKYEFQKVQQLNGLFQFRAFVFVFLTIYKITK